MQLYYYAGFEGVSNFGDELNLFIWNNYLSGIFDDIDDEVFVGIGTLINKRIPKAKRVIIMGSGVGYGELPSPEIISGWEIYCLRGKLSAKKLGVSESLVATDPAILMHKLFSRAVQKKYKFAYMPHWMNMGKGWEVVCENLGFRLIDPLGSVEDVVKGIQESEIVIAEAMHGAIVADALRVPWIAVHSNFGDYFPFKWEDWCSSLDIEYTSTGLARVWHPEDISTLSILKKIVKKSFSSINLSLLESRLKKIAINNEPTLSVDDKFKTALEKIEYAVNRFKQNEI